MSALSMLRHPVVRGGLLALTFGFIAWALARQWADVRQAAASVTIAWPWVAAASGVVLATYAMLIQSWRLLLRGWGGELAYPVAVRIWTIANLGRYLPGKVWSIGALGVLATREGVSGLAAAGAAVLGTVLNLGAGIAIAVVTGADALDRLYPGLRVMALGASLAFVVGVAILPALLPRLLDRFSRGRGLPLARQQLAAHTIWATTAFNAIAWIGYGVAFALFARGVTPQVSGNPTTFIAVFSASYLIGYLVLFAPGGLGFREVALSGLLVGMGAAGQGDAAILGAASRVWLTMLEVLPGVVGLLWLPPAQRAALRRSGSP
ncbi:MAG: lysylphosphatidylglycerol synthase domain-containing protein [Gemmatimonas sp.]|uniref:lysylphosphatidylglycerol synthase domain-containing protein n=1 Tax=Gemmatimonas sp. TaxID=1962908 RepID=UPI00391F1E08|nr:flippase-like domain-containing protein [Gemmatimonadota bacterium]